MNGFQKFYAVVVSAITLLAVLAAWSRISTMKEGPKTITAGANALARLFNGAFGQ